MLERVEITKTCNLREYGDKVKCVLYVEDKDVVYALGLEALLVATYEKEGVEVAWDLYFPLEKWDEIVERVSKILIGGERVDLSRSQKTSITRRLVR